MTTRLPFYFVDVFAPRPLTGNPLSLATRWAPGCDWRTRAGSPRPVPCGRRSPGRCCLSRCSARPAVPAADRAAVDRAAPDSPRLKSVLRQADAEGCYLYSRDPVDAADAVAYARFFNPTVGIAEDPAAGTAAGPLAARLVADGRVPDGSTVIIEQGYALGRPSRIAVSVAGQRVRVGGSGLVVAEGALIL